MTSPKDGELVPESSELLRLPRCPRDFQPDRWRPSYSDFQPSSDDKLCAQRRNAPVRVSVWDHSLTTVTEAKAFRQVEVVVVTLENRAVCDLARRSNLLALRAVYDPLPPPDSDRPGSHGHAGIEGLQRETGQSKLKYRELLEDLAACAHLYVGGSGQQRRPPVQDG